MVKWALLGEWRNWALILFVMILLSFVGHIFGDFTAKLSEDN